MALKEWRARQAELEFFKAQALSLKRQVLQVRNLIQLGKIESIHVPDYLGTVLKTALAEANLELNKYRKVSRLKDGIRETFRAEGYTVSKIGIEETSTGFSLDLEVKTKNKKL